SRRCAASSVGLYRVSSADVVLRTHRDCAVWNFSAGASLAGRSCQCTVAGACWADCARAWRTACGAGDRSVRDVIGGAGVQLRVAVQHLRPVRVVRCRVVYNTGPAYWRRAQLGWRRYWARVGRAFEILDRVPGDLAGCGNRCSAIAAPSSAQPVVLVWSADCGRHRGAEPHMAGAAPLHHLADGAFHPRARCTPWSRRWVLHRPDQVHTLWVSAGDCGARIAGAESTFPAAERFVYRPVPAFCACERPRLLPDAGISCALRCWSGGAGTRSCAAAEVASRECAVGCDRRAAYRYGIGFVVVPADVACRIGRMELADGAQ